MPWKEKIVWKNASYLLAGQVPFENLVRAVDYLFVLKFAPMFRTIRDSLMTVHRSPRVLVV